MALDLVDVAPVKIDAQVKTMPQAYADRIGQIRESGRAKNILQSRATQAAAKSEQTFDDIVVIDAVRRLYQDQDAYSRHDSPRELAQIDLAVTNKILQEEANELSHTATTTKGKNKKTLEAAKELYALSREITLPPSPGQPVSQNQQLLDRLLEGARANEGNESRIRGKDRLHSIDLTQLADLTPEHDADTDETLQVIPAPLQAPVEETTDQESTSDLLDNTIVRPVNQTWDQPATHDFDDTNKQQQVPDTTDEHELVTALTHDAVHSPTASSDTDPELQIIGRQTPPENHRSKISESNSQILTLLHTNQIQELLQQERDELRATQLHEEFMRNSRQPLTTENRPPEQHVNEQLEVLNRLLDPQIYTRIEHPDNTAAQDIVFAYRLLQDQLNHVRKNRATELAGASPVKKTIGVEGMGQNAINRLEDFLTQIEDQFQPTPTADLATVQRDNDIVDTSQAGQIEPRTGAIIVGRTRDDTTMVVPGTIKHWNNPQLVREFTQQHESQHVQEPAQNPANVLLQNPADNELGDATQQRILIPGDAQFHAVQSGNTIKLTPETVQLETPVPVAPVASTESAGVLPVQPKDTIQLPNLTVQLETPATQPVRSKDTIQFPIDTIQTDAQAARVTNNSAAQPIQTYDSQAIPVPVNTTKEPPISAQPDFNDADTYNSLIIPPVPSPDSSPLRTTPIPDQQTFSDPDAMYKHFEKLKELDSTDPAPRIGMAVAIMRRADEFQVSYPPTHPAHRYAVQYYEQVLIIIEQALVETQYNNSELHYYRGAALTKLGRHQEAIPAYQEAIHFDDTNPVYYTGIATAHYSLGQRERAVKDYDKAIALDPNNIQYYQDKVDLLCHLQRFQEALSICDTAHRLEPDALRPYEQQEVILLMLAQTDQAFQAHYEQQLAIVRRQMKQIQSGDFVHDAFTQEFMLAEVPPSRRAAVEALAAKTKKPELKIILNKKDSRVTTTTAEIKRLIEPRDSAKRQIFIIISHITSRTELDDVDKNSLLLHVLDNMKIQGVKISHEAGYAQTSLLSDSTEPFSYVSLVEGNGQKPIKISLNEMSIPQGLTMEEYMQAGGYPTAETPPSVIEMSKEHIKPFVENMNQFIQMVQYRAPHLAWGGKLLGYWIKTRVPKIIFSPSYRKNRDNYYIQESENYPRPPASLVQERQRREIEMQERQREYEEQRRGQLEQFDTMQNIPLSQVPPQSQSVLRPFAPSPSESVLNRPSGSLNAREFAIPQGPIQTPDNLNTRQIRVLQLQEEVIPQAINSAQFRDAAAAYDELLSLQPNNEILLVRAADLYRDYIGDYDRAIALYNNAHALNPNLLDFYDGLIQLYNIRSQREGRTNYNSEIATLLNELYDREPDNIIRASYIAEKFAEIGDTQRSRQIIETIRNTYDSLDPNSSVATVLYNLEFDEADLHFHSGEYEEALASYDRLLQLSPNNVLVMIQSAKAQYHLGRFEEAFKLYYDAEIITIDARRPIFNPIHLPLPSAELSQEQINSYSAANREAIQNRNEQITQQYIQDSQRFETGRQVFVEKLNRQNLLDMLYQSMNGSEPDPANPLQFLPPRNAPHRISQTYQDFLNNTNDDENVA